MVGCMCTPLAAAAPISAGLARRLDMPISAVPSMIAAMPVVEPSAAMSKVVPGCCALNCSASCGTSFAPRVSEPLMTSFSARASMETKASPSANARCEIFIFYLSAVGWPNELKFDVQIGHEELVPVKRVDADGDRGPAGAESV